MAMEVEISKSGDEATVAVSGLLNAATASDLEARVGGAMQGCTSIVFDFSHLEYISSAGLRVLMVAYKRATAEGGTLRVTGTSDEVREVFEITGFTDLFDVE